MGSNKICKNDLGRELIVQHCILIYEIILKSLPSIFIFSQTKMANTVDRFSITRVIRLILTFFTIYFIINRTEIVRQRRFRQNMKYD